MFAVCDASSLLVQTDPRVQNAIAYLQSLGSTLVGNTAYNGAWAMIAVKGQGKLAEAQDNSPTSSVTISAQPTLAINADAGAYPVPRISGVPARSNDWTLTIVEPGASGFYQILQSPDLASWTTVATIPVSSSGATSWTDTHAPTSATQRFYRIYRGY
jgi:hypothetical protein